MDILRQQEQDKKQALQSEKYLRVKERAYELTGKNIAFKLVDPSSMTARGNYNDKTAYGPNSEVVINIPFNPSTLDLSEDMLLAFVLLEYFYVFEGKEKINKLFLVSSIAFLIIICVIIMDYRKIINHNVNVIVSVMAVYIAVYFIRNSYLKRFSSVDKRCAGLTGNTDALISLLDIFKKVELESDEKTRSKNDFLQKRIDKLQLDFEIGRKKIIS